MLTDELEREKLGQVQAGDTLLFVHPLPCAQIRSSVLHYWLANHIGCHVTFTDETRYKNHRITHITTKSSFYLVNRFRQKNQPSLSHISLIRIQSAPKLSDNKVEMVCTGLCITMFVLFGGARGAILAPQRRGGISSLTSTVLFGDSFSDNGERSYHAPHGAYFEN